jgi:hypothetical protein
MRLHSPLSLLALLTLAASVPTATTTTNTTNTTSLTPRTPPPAAKPGSFRMCTLPHWHGTCTTINLVMPECWNVRKPFRDGSIGSLTPNVWRGRAEFRYDCAVFEEPGCMGNGVVLRAPGREDLSGTRVQSVRCEYVDREAVERLRGTVRGAWAVWENWMRMGED